MGAFVVANQKVEIVPKKQTWLEAIHDNSLARRRIKPNSFHNEALLGYDCRGNLKKIHGELLKARPFYTGTAAVMGAEGKSLGKWLEAECDYEGQRKTVIFEASTIQAGPADTVILCSHSFAADGASSIPLFDAGTGKLLATREDMLAANNVILKFNGNVFTRRIWKREGGVLDLVSHGRDNTYLWAPPSAVLGLLSRGHGLHEFVGDIRWDVMLGNQPSLALSVVVQAPSNAIVLEGWEFECKIVPIR